MKDIHENLNERFYIFDNFLKSNEHILQRGNNEWDSSKIFFQLAIEHANKSPLSIDADKFEEDGKVDFDYVRDVNRDEEMYISPLVAILEGHKNPIHKVLKKENLIYSISKDTDIKIWDIYSYKLIETLSGHTNSVSDIILMDNGNIVSSSHDHTLKIWDKHSFKNRATLKGHRSFINAIKLLQSGNILSLSDDNVRVWNKNTFKCIVSLNSGTYNDVEMFEENGHKLCFLEDKIIQVLDKDTNKLIEILSIYEYENDAFWEDRDLKTKKQIMFNENTLLSVVNDTVEIKNKTTDETIATLIGHASRINGIETLDNNHILTYSDDGDLRVWNMNKLKYAKYKSNINSKIKNEENEEKIVLQNQNILSFESNKIMIHNHDNKLVMTLEEHEDDIDGILLIDNKRFLSHSEDEIIKIWNIDNYNCFKTLEDTGYSIDYVKVLKDKSIATFCDMELKIWDCSFNKICECEIDSDCDIVNILLLSNDDILSFDGTDSLYILNKYSGEVLHELTHNDNIENVLLLENNNIFSYSIDNVLKIWDINNYKDFTITKDNISQYYHLLPHINKRVDDDKIIIENYFEEYYLNIIDKETNQKLQWHSNYKPEVNKLIGENISINNGINKRILKVIKQKKEQLHGK
jgi:WD40 repeat protein